MPPPGSDKQPTLLLVDDEPLIHRLLTFKLRHDGIDFISAYSGEQGLELAATRSPALMLLDLGLPDLDGFEVIRRMKLDAATMHTPILVISASDESRDKVLAFELGAMDYVSKPFDIYELRARIRSALNLRRLMEMLEKRAQIDGLTGLWNRTHFDERLEDELARSYRSGSPISLVMADIDHFKRVNDEFGHQGGDLVLQTFSLLLTSTLRSCDIACRYGGEEFAIILPETIAEDARRVCERVRATFESRTWPAFPDMSSTVSIGIACHEGEEAIKACDLLASADDAMYSAKRNGRNQICVDTGDGDPASGDLRLAG